MAKVLQRHESGFVYFGVALLSLPVGLVVARGEGTITMPLLALLALAGATILTSIPTSTVFLGWLFLAPIIQEASTVRSSVGSGLTWALYTAPILLFAVLTVIRRDRSLPSSRVDWLPGLYVAYVLTSMYLTSDVFRSNPAGGLKVALTIVAIGAIVYYYLVLGPGLAVTSERIVAVLMAAGVVQGLMALIDAATHWNLWGYHEWQIGSGPARAVATLANPGLLGMFLGVSIVCAVAVLTWDGPRALRRPSWAVLAVSTPGLLATLTRGPIVATAVTVVVVLLLGRARLIAIGALAASVIAILFMLPSLSKTELYEDRVAGTANVRFREALRDWSIRLAAQKPVFGWGYGSFDEAKNTSGFYSQGVPIRNILVYTSHDTYLTLLVELGALGLLLFAAPFLVLGYQGVARARAPGPDRWLLVAALGSLSVGVLTANTLDFRFFSIALMLPFVFLAILRRGVASPRAAG